LYKALFTDEILKTTTINANKPELKLKMEMPMSAYEQYKKQQDEKAKLKIEEEKAALKTTTAKRPPTGSSDVAKEVKEVKTEQPSNQSLSATKDSTNTKSTTQTQISSATPSNSEKLPQP
jgi:hypothetical protein